MVSHQDKKSYINITFKSSSEKEEEKGTGGTILLKTEINKYRNESYGGKFQIKNEVDISEGVSKLEKKELSNKEKYDEGSNVKKHELNFSDFKIEYGGGKPDIPSHSNEPKNIVVLYMNLWMCE